MKISCVLFGCLWDEKTPCLPGLEALQCMRCSRCGAYRYIYISRSHPSQMDDQMDDKGLDAQGSLQG